MERAVVNGLFCQIDEMNVSIGNQSVVMDSIRKICWALCLTLMFAMGCGDGCDDQTPVDESPDAAMQDMGEGAGDMPTQPGEDMGEPDLAAPQDMGGEQDLPDPMPDMDVNPPEDMTNPPRDMNPPEDMGPPDMEVTDLRVDAVIPPRGPVRGGTPFVVEGAGFTTSSVVFFGPERTEVELVDGNLVGLTPEGSAPGSVNVRVIDPDRGDETLIGGFTYTATLEVFDVVPSRIPTTGGVEVEVTGTGFDADTRVSLAGQTALRHTVVDEYTMRVIAPPGPKGVADVRVTNLDASVVLPEGVEYFAPLEITAVRPATGPVAGGQDVQLVGNGFEQGMTVEFGGRLATLGAVSAAGDEATVTTPSASGPGLVDVRIVSPSGDAIIGQDLFYYSDSATPELVSITPSSGPVSGGNEVVLLGANLDVPGLSVDFGGAAAQITMDKGPGHLRVLAPAGNIGPVTVTITDGVNSDAIIDGYAYVEDLWIDRLTPNSGDVAGGYPVVIEGEGYTGATRVTFGGVQAQFVVDSPTQITATAPARSAGIVDVSVERGDVRATFKDSFTYTEDLEVHGFSPVRGSIAGNTYVEVRGRGFVGDIDVMFGQQAAADVQILDSQTLAVRTPPVMTPQSVEVSVAARNNLPVVAADRYTYFNPGARFGGAWGGPIAGAVNVTVYSQGGGPLENAFVMLSTRPDTQYQGLTNANGMVTLSGPDIFGDQTVTATAAGYSSATVQRVDAENITIFLSPPPSNGTPPAGPSPATFTGHVSGLNKLAEPGPTEFQMAIVYTTQANPFQPNPPPGNGNVVLMDGQYTLTSRLGDLALIAVGGLYDNATQTFTPLRMGVARYQFASEGQTYNVDLDLDIPLEQTLPVKMNNAPSGPNGPNGNSVKTWLDFGFEGVFGNLPLTEGMGNLQVVEHLPLLTGQIADVTLFIEAGSYTNGDAPYSIGLARDVTTLNQVLEIEMLGVPEVISPTSGNSPLNGLVTFNYNSPTQPDLFYVRVQTFMQATRWEAFIPGNATSVRLPTFPDFSHLPPDQRPAPYTGEQLVLLIIAIKQPGLDLNNFSYADLSQDKWTAYSLGFQIITL